MGGGIQTNKTNNKTKHTSAETPEIHAKQKYIRCSEIHPVFRRADTYMTYFTPRNKGRAQRFPRPSEGGNTSENTIFLPQKGERTNEQEHLILSFLNQSEIQLFSSSRRDFSSAVDVSKVTSDGTCSRSSNKSINLEIME